MDRMKSLESDEHVSESTGNPQNSGTSESMPDDPQYDSSSSESTSAAITKKHEKKRRSRKLLRQLRELSSIIPEASDKEVIMFMDKEAASSIVEDAIKYTKQLEERVKKLEEELITGPNHGSNSKEEELEIEVKTDGEDQQNVLVKIICGKSKGQIARIISEIEELHLSVSSISALPFGGQLLVISVSAQMGDEFCMTANDLKKNLRVALLKFMRHV